MKIAVDSMGGLITAEEASKKENLAREYKCVNKDCNQKVILCAKESTVVNPYFRVEKGKLFASRFFCCFWFSYKTIEFYPT